MKRKIFTFCLSTGFAFALSMGAVGCLITGFDLALQKESTVIFACLISAVIGSGLLQIPHGGKILAALTLLAGSLLWFRPDAQHQLLSLIGDVTLMYHRAYEWGWLEVGSRGAAADLPMAFLGTLVSLSACRTLCLGKGSWLTVVLGALPLAACLVVTNTVPQKTFLFCLLAPLILLILTSYIRQEDAPQGNRLTAMAALPVILALAGLFLAIPQEGYVNHSEALRNDLLHYIDYLPQIMEDTLAEVASEIQGEEIKNVNLRDLGPKPRYTHKVMEVTAETGGLLYLRGQDYDSYNGTGWTATAHRAESLVWEGRDLGTVSVTTRSSNNMLYLPYYPAETVLLAGGMVQNKENLRTYSFRRAGLPENWAEENLPEGEVSLEYGVAEVPVVSDLERLAFGSTAERLRYLTLPGETKIQAQALLDGFLDRNQSRPAQAEAIAEYVRNCAAYNLNTRRMPSDQEDFALWFLQESDTGYCVHFATAAVVLLRAADIPARYVTGYAAEVKAGQATPVTAGQAHAWAEYYLPSLGTWVVLDATPAEGTVLPTETESISEIPFLPSEQTLPPATETESTQPPETTISPETQPPELPEETESNGSGKWWLLFLPVIAIPVQRQLRLKLRQNRRHSGTTNAQALARWQETVILARLLQEETPRELFDLAQKAKFSPHTLTADELLFFEGYRKSAQHRLRQHPWYRQLLYRWFWAVY